ncbi:MAG: sigma-70 family RNA polymerase sigma factor [Calditrichaeota bacterium]|nr:MAG: sigma-70 family RNA polymerase sigma factor [Calditrichota bacterium]
MAISYKQLSNKKLLKVCKKLKINELAWLEFYNRFHPVISNYIYKWNGHYRFFPFHNDFKNSISDLNQTIFLKLLDNNRKALRSFRNESEVSIYAYLAKIVKCEVINYAKHCSAMKRNAPTVSVYEPINSAKREDSLVILDLIATKDGDLEEEHKYKERVDMYKKILRKENKNKNWNRDIIIFELAFEHGLKADEICEIGSLGISKKRIANRITELKKLLKK